MSGYAKKRYAHTEVSQWHVSQYPSFDTKTFWLRIVRDLRFDRLADAPLDEEGKIAKKYDIIQMDGLPGVGERVDPGDVFINKQSPTNASDNSFTGQAASVPYKNTPMSYKSPVPGQIDKVLISDTENDQTLIKVLIRQTRRPELGDKFSSRHGQKGVCGLIVNQEDMPFNDQGINPGASSSHSDDVAGMLLTFICRYNYEPTWFPISYDGREDDRASRGEGYSIHYHSILV